MVVEEERDETDDAYFDETKLKRRALFLVIYAPKRGILEVGHVYFSTPSLIRPPFALVVISSCVIELETWNSDNVLQISFLSLLQT